MEMTKTESSVLDTAAWFLKHLGSMSPEKLHALAWFSQGWSLGNGYRMQFHEFILIPKKGDGIEIGNLTNNSEKNISKLGIPERIDSDGILTVKMVFNNYRHLDDEVLMDLITQTMPYQNAVERRKASKNPGRSGPRRIIEEDLHQFYGRIIQNELRRYIATPNQETSRRNA